MLIRAAAPLFLVTVTLSVAGCWGEPIIPTGAPSSGTGDVDATSTGESGSEGGDGDPTTGDGDGDPGDGDGDGDPVTGDGDGDSMTGDGDGDGPACGNGVVEDDEACDKGPNPEPTSGCTSTCEIPRSCLEILDHFGLEAVQALPEGTTYLIAPRDGVTTWSALCDMTTAFDGEVGGWTGIRLHNTCDPEDPEDLDSTNSDLARGIEVFEAAEFAIDDQCRPSTLDDESQVHTYAMDITFPPGFGAIHVEDYAFKARAGVNQGSELGGAFIQPVWEIAHNASRGDISFGSASDPGPATSVSAEGVEGEWPNDTVVEVGDIPAFAVSPDSTVLRIGWGEAGGHSEGWYPWWDGVIYVR